VQTNNSTNNRRNQIVTVDTYSGPYGFQKKIPLEITPKKHLGVINDNARRALNTGQCHSLAYVISKETGWPILGVGDADDSPNHCVVYHPGIDDYVDISGPGALKRGSHGEWAMEMIREFPLGELEAGLPLYLPMNVKAATPFAKSLLNRIKKLPATVNTPIKKAWMNGNKAIKGYKDAAIMPEDEDTSWA
jgi:hypothetical protein